MKILITGATGNVGKGMVARLREAGHDLILHDLEPVPDGEPFAGLPFIPGDAQAGIGFAACERIFPGSRRLVEKYQINVARPPAVVDLGDTPQTIGYQPRRHFGTFLQELARLDAEGGEAFVTAKRCPY